MSTAGTGSYSGSGAFTEPRARYVVEKIYEELLNIFFRGLLTKATIVKWKDDLYYIMCRETLDYFEVQFLLPDGSRKGFHYKLDDNGNISTDDETGGIDYYVIPDGAKVNIMVELKQSSKNYTEVFNELTQKRGWGTNGKVLEGSKKYLKAYSMEGYGTNKSMVGTW